ncbi:OmpA family protein [Flavobacterium algicola]|uniref:OmpA family protein n=1 Tax=Flavobacterium algicola TaxID=556529 RepID=UPI001EFCC14C|nr:OmpA family protein [Flavobacterium algicola]MCG9791810.1 OmpA family protein [Flavobacterium algicola]
MKKLIITLVFASAFTAVNAQSEAKKEIETEKYNKWSIEASGGVSKPLNKQGSAFGFVTPFTVDLGVRYMINNKFGIKGDLGYNALSEKSGTPDFESRYYRGDLQAVANLGRIMSFETWTNTIGLLGHGGVGLGMVRQGDTKDWVGNGILGLTAQVKLSDHFAFTLDGSAILNVRQNLNFDASTGVGRQYGGILNGTAGITYYIGKNTKHADWIVLDVTNGLEARVSELEAMNLDTDKDGVVDYLDLEPNTMSGVMVDGKGRAIDANNNGIPDEIEKYIDSKYKTGNGSGISDDTIKGLVNGGYVGVFFDFNKSTPNTESTDALAYVLTYLRNNPSATVDIIGHADEIGSTSYNNNLSSARANNVKQTLLKSNVAASRLNVVAAGEDTSVNVNSDAARKLVRRVTFFIK